jgi:CheY-like chemotaxis protein
MATILVIDDAPDILFMLSDFLTDEGHTVTTAADGRSGMQLVALHHYDLVITDIIMPEMDGLEVITAIREQSPDSRLIVLTGGSVKLGRDFLMTLARAMHPDRVIAKPVNLQELRSAVHELFPG